MTLQLAKQIGSAVAPWLANALCAVLIGWASNLQNRVSAVETTATEFREFRAATSANRWTSADQSAFAKEQSVEISKLWSAHSSLQRELLTSIGDIKVSISGVAATLESLKQERRK